MLWIVHFNPVLFAAISWGDPPESQIPAQKTRKNTQNTKKNIKKCIEFTPPPQICVFPLPEPGV